MKLEDYEKEIILRRTLLREKASSSLLDFIYYCNWQYKANWHHELIATQIQDFWTNPDNKQLMLFVPPQHGKSEIASRYFPAWVLGNNPNTKIAAASYSIDLARAFNRDVQRIIESEEYSDVFKDTRLSGKRVANDSKGNYLRNTEEFEVINKKGSYKSVGVMGGLSGRTVDLAIIDDPVKDALEANSSTYRARVWDWYTNVLKTRLHNLSKVVLIMTRWHEDDLAGRLLKKEPEKWEVIKIQAVKTEPPNEIDRRVVGQPLWPDKHSLEKLQDIKALNPTTYDSLYQQEPGNPEGELIKKSWWVYVDEDDVPNNITRDMWIDGAYTEKTRNDPSGIVIKGFDDRTQTLYIFFATSKYMGMPELMACVEDYAEIWMDRKSRSLIEPKASGTSLRQMLNAKTDVNAVDIKSKLVSQGKTARATTASPRVESGRVKIVRGSWNEEYVNQISSFPKAKHDEYVDLIGYACDYYFKTNKKGVTRRN